MSFDVEIGHTSRRGPREANEDFGGAMRGDDRTRGLIAALADGVSTGGQGLEAAQTTVMGLLADFFAAPETWETTVVFDRLIAAQNAWPADHNRRRQARNGGDRIVGLANNRTGDPPFVPAGIAIDLLKEVVGDRDRAVIDLQRPRLG